MDVTDFDSLSQAQQERRLRMLEVASQLASEGGYDSVGMREVAERAETSLATVYRHFTSKDGLLLAVMNHEIDALLADTRSRRGPVGPDQLIKLLTRLTSYLLARPSWTAAMLQAWTTARHEDDPVRDAVSTTARLNMVYALTGTDTDSSDDIALATRVVNQVWFAELLTQAHRDRPSVDEVMTPVRFAVERLL